MGAAATHPPKIATLPALLSIQAPYPTLLHGVAPAMTYVALAGESGDLSHLPPPIPQTPDVFVAPCIDPCETTTMTVPQGSPPEPSRREFSARTSHAVAARANVPGKPKPATDTEASPIATDAPGRPAVEPPTAPSPVLPETLELAPPETFPQEPLHTNEAAIPVEPEANEDNAPAGDEPAAVVPVQTLKQPTEADIEALPDPPQQMEASVDFSVFPVGISIGRREVDQGVLVRGQEDGRQAIAFEDWLIPYDAVVNALNLSVTSLPDGQLEVRSPGIVVRLDPDELRTDPDLGLVFSIREIADLFGVPANFDINEYAIRFEPPWLTLDGSRFVGPDVPIDLEGLPVIAPPEVSITQFEQRIGLSDRDTSDTDVRGGFNVVGALPDASSWFLRVDQSDLLDADSWQLAEAQILRQRDELDITLGSQAAFWRNGGGTNLWGLTIVGRNGYTPADLRLGGTSPRQRLQSAFIGRTITGEAEPGTLVRLTEGFGDRIIAEVFVDSSGIYRFDDIPVGDNLLSSNYLLLLYPDGRLTELPEVRTVSFTNVGGQIPAGTSAWAVAAGWDRDRSDTGFFGELDEFRGGALYRVGVSESLTLGAGAVYDNGVRGLGELFLQPADVPLQVAASVLTPDDEGEWDWDATVRYDPTPTLRASLSSDPIDTRLNLGWQVVPELELISLVRTENPSEFGAQVSVSGRNAFTFARLTIDTEGDIRWSGTQRWGPAELTTRGDDISTLTEVAYNFSGDRIFDTGHAAFASYETRNLERGDGQLTTVGWRYRSAERAVDGNFEWEAQLGVGFGSEGSGLVARLQTAAMPGVLLRARYDGITPTSGEDAFRLEIVSSLNVQGRIRPGDRRTNFLRTQGGLFVEPFYDENLNGQLDAGEEQFTDNAELLLVLNNEPIRSFRPDISDETIALRTFPGTYRLDLDPAGYPIDWQPDTRAFAVVINPGVYTILPLPFVPAYTVSGIATDALGNPLAGARIEAIAPTGERVLSITNDAGVFFLEGLRRGTYTLAINGNPAEPGTLELDATAEPFQELNLRLPASDM